MNSLLASLLLGFLTFLFIVNIFSIRMPNHIQLQNRLEKIKNRRVAKAASKKTDAELSFLYSNFRYKIFAKKLNNLRFTEKIKSLISLAGVNMEVDTFIIISIMCTLPFVVIFAMTVPKLLPVSIIGAFIPYSMLKANTTKRNENFAKQLPDALDLISSSLRAGHSIYSAFEVVTKEMSMPISGISAWR